MTPNNDGATPLGENGEHGENDEHDVAGHSLLHEQVFNDIAAARSRNAATSARNHSLLKGAHVTETRRRAPRRAIRRILPGPSTGTLLILVALAIV